MYVVHLLQSARLLSSSNWRQKVPYFPSDQVKRRRFFKRERAEERLARLQQGTNVQHFQNNGSGRSAAAGPVHACRTPSSRLWDPGWHVSG